VNENPGDTKYRGRCFRIGEEHIRAFPDDCGSAFITLRDERGANHYGFCHVHCGQGLAAAALFRIPSRPQWGYLLVKGNPSLSAGHPSFTLYRIGLAPGPVCHEHVADLSHGEDEYGNVVAFPGYQAIPTIVTTDERIYMFCGVGSYGRSELETWSLNVDDAEAGGARLRMRRIARLRLNDAWTGMGTKPALYEGLATVNLGGGGVSFVFSPWDYRSVHCQRVFPRSYEKCTYLWEFTRYL
jgi:hypothetical protein